MSVNIKGMSGMHVPETEANGVPGRLCSGDHIQAKGLSKSGRKSMDGHLKWGSGRKASIASHSLMPAETPVSPLRSGLHLSVLSLHLPLLFLLGRARGEGDGLCPKHTLQAFYTRLAPFSTLFMALFDRGRLL